MATEIDWNQQLLDQLAWHWDHQLRPRFVGLTDDEYVWEPVPGCWSLRRRADVTTPIAAGQGDWVLEFAVPQPEHAPVTTIAWRIGHLLVGVFGQRNANHFGGPPADYESYTFPVAASDALTQLDAAYERWMAGVRGLGNTRLAEPVGPAEGPWHDYPYAGLILHIHREVIHHGAEIALLRDLYRATNGRGIA